MRRKRNAYMINQIKYFLKNNRKVKDMYKWPHSDFSKEVKSLSLLCIDSNKRIYVIRILKNQWMTVELFKFPQNRHVDMRTKELSVSNNLQAIKLLKRIINNNNLHLIRYPMKYKNLINSNSYTNNISLLHVLTMDDNIYARIARKENDEEFFKDRKILILERKYESNVKIYR